MGFVQDSVAKSKYARALGIELDEAGDEGARLSLPFREENANPGGVLHGGVYASLGVAGAQVVARQALGEETGPWHTTNAQVSYLAAAREEVVTARCQLLRKGKELCFVQTDVSTESGKLTAQIQSVVRARHGSETASLIAPCGDDGESDPGPMGSIVDQIPFHRARGMHIENMKAGRSRIVMPALEENESAEGNVHEGALLALVDTAGAMASWAETGPGAYKASTASLQGQILTPSPKGDLVAWGRVVQRDREIFWSDVEVATSRDGRLCARGTVIYRIVT